MRPLRTFELFEPESVEEACQLLISYDPKTIKLLAGGLDLLPRLRQRQIEPEHIISLQRITGLDYVEHDDKNGLMIGAMTSIRSVDLSPIVKKEYSVLYEAAHHIASIQVKTMGTLVGNLCVATPASDLAVSLFVLSATLRVVSASAERIVPIGNFYVGVNQTALQAGEMVVGILVPSPPPRTGGAFLKMARTATDVAKINVAAMITIENGRCKQAKLALGSVAPTPIRAMKAEEILNGQELKKNVIASAARAAAEAAKAITDIRSTAEYRNEMVEVLTKRAIDKALVRLRV